MTDLQVTDILGYPTEAQRAEKKDVMAKETGTSQASVATTIVSKATVSPQADVT